MPAGLFAAADLLTAAALRSARAAGACTGSVSNRARWPVRMGMALRAETRLDAQRWRPCCCPASGRAHRRSCQPALGGQLPLQQALRALPRSVPLWTWCTWVALAAAAGRLDGEAATGTWWMAAQLSRAHPEVDWQWQAPMVSGRRVATASGVHGYLPILAQELERRISPEAWRDVQRLMVLPARSRPPACLRALQTLHGADPLLARLRRLVERTPAVETTLERLAEQLACSPRTLARKVGEAAGMPVGRYVRLRQAASGGRALAAWGRSGTGERDAGLCRMNRVSAQLQGRDGPDAPRLRQPLPALAPLPSTMVTQGCVLQGQQAMCCAARQIDQLAGPQGLGVRAQAEHDRAFQALEGDVARHLV